MRRLAMAAWCAGALLFATPAFAQDASEAASPGAEHRDLAADVKGGFLSEAWNYNLSHENLWGGSIGGRIRLSERWWIGGEASSFAVKQRGRDGWLIAVAPFVRWQPRARGARGWFVEHALGYSSADRRVPPRGTRLNYLVRLSGGARWALTSRVASTISVSWIHISNNSLEGRGHNPDIQSIGVMLGLSAPF